MGWASRAWDCVLHLKQDAAFSFSERAFIETKFFTCLLRASTYGTSGCTGWSSSCCCCLCDCLVNFDRLVTVRSGAVLHNLKKKRRRRRWGGKQNSGWNMAELSTTLCKFQQVASRRQILWKSEPEKLNSQALIQLFIVTAANEGWRANLGIKQGYRMMYK